MNKKYILFDLDGTLTDSGEGITKSVVYALEKFGIKATPEEVKHFVGPPLKENFMLSYNLTEEQATDAVEYFRERYAPIGIFENYPYEGIKELLKELKEKGNVLLVATSKPMVHAERVLEKFELYTYFDCVLGSELHGTENKTHIMKQVLEKAEVKNLSEVIMVGDTFYDLEGARNVGVDVIAVGYGYGKKEELKQADYFAETVTDLKNLLLG